MQGEPISLLINLLPTLVAAGLGWYVVHYLNSNRDRRNAERMIRLTELRNAHKILIKASVGRNIVRKNPDGSLSDFHENFEDMVASLQLFGTKEQVELCNIMVKELIENQKSDYTVLANELRNHIRGALGLEKLLMPATYLRIDISTGENGKSVSRI